MTVRREYLVGGSASMLTERRELADVCVVDLAKKDRLLTNISKNWHADCRVKVVSKILDWLVL